MASTMDDAMGSLANEDTWMHAVEAGAGFAGPLLASNVIEGTVDLPNELYGIAGVGVAGYAGYEYAAVGSGLYTLDALAGRVGLKSEITNMGGN